MITNTFRAPALRASICSLCFLVPGYLWAAGITLVNPPEDFGATTGQSSPGAMFGDLFTEAVDTTGDFANMVNPDKTPIFAVDAEISSFVGTFGSGTVGDPSDAFVLKIGPGQTLESVQFVFDLNADPFNPVVIADSSYFLMEDSSGQLPGDLLRFEPFPLFSGSPTTFDSATDSTVGYTPLQEGLYNVFVVGGTLGANSARPIAYQINFTVVPEPSGLIILAIGAVCIGGACCRRKVVFSPNGSVRTQT